MPLPKKFDENEIFIIIVSIIFTLILVYLFPKRLSYPINIIIILFNISIGITTDHILAGPPLDLYDVMDSKKFELFDLILYIFVYGPFTYIAIYIYDKWLYHKSTIKKFFYLVFLSLLNTGFEVIAVYLKIYIYHGWKPYYSFSVYLLIYYINFHLIKLLKNTEIKEQILKDNLT